jgi:hypothetical protein
MHTGINTVYAVQAPHTKKWRTNNLCYKTAQSALSLKCHGRVLCM